MQRCICENWADRLGHHALSCGHSADKFKRHFALNATIARSLTSAGFHCDLEPPGLSDLDHKGPDGQTTSPWSSGERLAWDATCVCKLAISHLARTSETLGSAAVNTEGIKIRHYEDLAPNFHFRPLESETMGF